MAAERGIKGDQALQPVVRKCSSSTSATFISSMRRKSRMSSLPSSSATARSWPSAAVSSRTCRSDRAGGAPAAASGCRHSERAARAVPSRRSARRTGAGQALAIGADAGQVVLRPRECHGRHEAARASCRPCLSSSSVVDHVGMQAVQEMGDRRDAKTRCEFLRTRRSAEVAGCFKHQHLAAALCQTAAATRPLWPPPMTIASNDVMGRTHMFGAALTDRAGFRLRRCDRAHP